MEPVRTTQADVARDVIDLGVGHPSPSLLPMGALREAADRRLSDGDTTLLQYGFEQGDGNFRLALARFLSVRYSAGVGPEELFVTGGASQALDLICTIQTRPGDLVLVEQPSYFLALRIFSDHNLEVKSLPTDDEGLDVGALEKTLAHKKPVLLYTVPTHQNPSGTTLSQNRRLRLVELSREHDFLIVADEVYHLLSYGSAPPSPFGNLTELGNVLSLGSFSKILAPGLRLGWIQSTPERLQPLVTCGLLDSGGGLNPFTSALVHSFLESGRQSRHLDMLRTVYGKRLAAMSSALRGQLGGLVRFREPDGGFFFWLSLPADMDARKLHPVAYEHKIGFMPGPRFSGGSGLENCLRLSFSYYEAQELSEGVNRLAESIRRTL